LALDGVVGVLGAEEMDVFGDNESPGTDNDDANNEAWSLRPSSARAFALPVKRQGWH